MSLALLSRMFTNGFTAAFHARREVQMTKGTKIIIMAALFLACTVNLVSAARFYAVGRADKGWQINNSDFGMSADGKVIVSGARTPDWGLIEAYRWSPDAGKTMLGFYSPIDDAEPESFAYATSADGSVIVGSSLVDDYDAGNLRVVEISGFSLRNDYFTPLGWLDGDDEAYPFDVTANGSFAVGYSYELGFWFDIYLTAVKWHTLTGLIQELGTLDGDDDSIALAVSGDGSVIVGRSGEIDEYWRPAVWIFGNWHALELLTDKECPGWLYTNQVYGVSNCGYMAVGQLCDGENRVPVRWVTHERSPITLPLLSEDKNGAAFDVTPHIPYRGHIIGGSSDDKAVLWETASNHPILVETLLQPSLTKGDDINGWQLTEVRQISDDGKTIAGYGIHPNGQKWIWYADLRNSPANDNCTTAQFIGQSPHNLYTHKASVNGTTYEATPDPGTPCVGPESVGVWYAYSSSVKGYLYLDLCGTTLQDPILSVFEGCPGTSANRVYCNSGCVGNPCGEPCVKPPHVKIEPGEMGS